jgi:hypothetical protein
MTASDRMFGVTGQVIVVAVCGMEFALGCFVRRRYDRQIRCSELPSSGAFDELHSSRLKSP